MGKEASPERVVQDIRRKTRRRFSAEEKIRIVLEGLRGEESIATLCRKEGLAPNLYYRWSKEFLEAGKKRLLGDTTREATSTEVQDLRRENSYLKQVVAETVLENRVLKKNGSPKVRVGPELAEGAPGGPVTGAFPGFSLGVLVMGQGPVEARGKRAVFSKARSARLCVRGAGSFHRACPFVTSGPRGALLHLPRVQLVKSICPYDLRCTCVIFQPERWGPNSQTLAPLRVRAHRGDHAL